MLPKLAISIHPDSFAHGQSLMTRAEAKNPDFIEIWCDNLSLNEAKELIAATSRPLILNLKDASEQGSFRGSAEERIDQLFQLANFSKEVCYIDLPMTFFENKKFAQQIERNKKQGQQIIASFHDFTATPSATELAEKIKSVQENPDVALVKIATQISSSRDLEELLRFYLASSIGGRLIIIGMGELGKSTRVMAPLLGIPLTFTALDSKNTTAPGQLTISEIREQWNSLKF